MAHSRGTMLSDNAELPDVDAPYMLELACEAGWYELSWPVLRAWQEAVCMPLSAWEANALIRMSSAYTKAVLEYNDKEAEAPYKKASSEPVTRSILRKRNG